MDENTDFVVLLGGAITVTDRLKAQTAGRRAVAADGGMRHAAALGLRPELWVGDFDSAQDELLAMWPDVSRLGYPEGKDETDGELAVSEALRCGARDIVLAGAFGGPRSDHALFHLLLACRLRQAGMPTLATSGEEEATPLVPGSRPQTFDLPEGALFSVIGFSAVTGITISGARYPLDAYTLPFGSSRTISNVADGPVSVAIDAGVAVFLARPYDFPGA